MMEELLDKYKKSLPKKAGELRSHLERFNQGEQAAKAEIVILAHSLHGSGATYGFPEVSEKAKLVEHSRDDAFVPSLIALLEVLESQGSMTEAKPSPGDRVLLIEDDADISDLIKTLLEATSPSFQVSVANSAALAKSHLQEGHFDLIVVDLILPDMDGREILAELKQQGPSNTLIFVLSGVGSEQVKNECLLLGADNFFHKPFNPQILVDEIVRALQEKDEEQSTNKGQTDEYPVSGRNDGLGKEGTGQISILLAEDDELLAEIILHRLTKEGMQVTHVTAGDLAFAKLRDEKFSLAILDVKMPVLDGLEVLFKTRQELSNNLPIIVLTAMGSEKDVVRGYELGANDYMLKPFSPPELMARVRSLLNQHT